MIRWTGLAPWEFEFPFPGSLTSTFLVGEDLLRGAFRASRGCAGCSFEMQLGWGSGEYRRQTVGRGRVEERVEAAILHIA